MQRISPPSAHWGEGSQSRGQAESQQGSPNLVKTRREAREEGGMGGGRRGEEEEGRDGGAESGGGIRGLRLSSTEGRRERGGKKRNEGGREGGIGGGKERWKEGMGRGRVNSTCN